MRRALTFAFLVLLARAIHAHPPVSVVTDSRGNVYYSDLEQVWRVAPNGTKSVSVPGVHTHELYIDARDNLYGEHLWYEGEASNKWGHYVWRRDAAGRVSMVIPRTEGFLKDYSFVRDRAGSQYWASADRKTLVKNKKVIARDFRDIRWMTVTPSGTVFFVDAGDVVRVAPDGRVTRLARGLTKNSLLRPHAADRHAVQGIWTDRAGNVYVAVSSQGEVRRITPDGRMSVVAESTMPWSPCGGAIAANGELLLLEYSITNAVRVRRVRMR